MTRFTNSQIDIALLIIDNATYHVEYDTLHVHVKTLIFNCATLHDMIDNDDEFNDDDFDVQIERVMSSLKRCKRLDD